MYRIRSSILQNPRAKGRRHTCQFYQGGQSLLLFMGAFSQTEAAKNIFACLAKKISPNPVQC